MAKKRGEREAAPSRHDYRQREFTRQVIGLSIGELGYRLTENLRQQARAEASIREFDDKRRAAAAESGQLRGEQEVLTRLIEERR